MFAQVETPSSAAWFIRTWSPSNPKSTARTSARREADTVATTRAINRRSWKITSQTVRIFRMDSMGREEMSRVTLSQLKSNNARRGNECWLARRFGWVDTNVYGSCIYKLEMTRRLFSEAHTVDTLSQYSADDASDIKDQTSHDFKFRTVCRINGAAAAKPNWFTEYTSSGWDRSKTIYMRDLQATKTWSSFSPSSARSSV